MLLMEEQRCTCLSKNGTTSFKIHNQKKEGKAGVSQVAWRNSCDIGAHLPPTLSIDVAFIVVDVAWHMMTRANETETPKHKKVIHLLDAYLPDEFYFYIYPRCITLAFGFNATSSPIQCLWRRKWPWSCASLYGFVQRDDWIGCVSHEQGKPQTISA